MAKVHYMVSMGDGSHGDFTDIREVAKALGVEKITKKDILNGKYPQVTIKDAPIAPIVADPELDDLASALEELDNQDSSEEPTVEAEPVYELNAHDMAAIEAINERMQELSGSLEPEDSDTYDELNRIYAIIQRGASDTFNDHQFRILTDTMTGSYRATPEDEGKGIESMEELDEALRQAGIDEPEVDEPEVDDDKPKHNTPVLTNLINANKQKLADQEIDYPEVGSFKEEKYLKRFYKQLSDEQLDEWIALEGLTYKTCEHESINRMRKCMAIMELHFPKKPKVNTKSKSKYSNYTTEELVAMATKAGIKVRDSKGSDQILRMYTIMDLRKAGLIS